MIWGVIGASLGILAITLLLVFKVLLPAAMGRGWGVLQDRFPGQPAAPGAVRRGFETFTVSGLRLGAGVTVEADGSHLHMRPGRLGRVIGCRDISVPWNQVQARDPIGV